MGELRRQPNGQGEPFAGQLDKLIRYGQVRKFRADYYDEQKAFFFAGMRQDGVSRLTRQRWKLLEDLAETSLAKLAESGNPLLKQIVVDEWEKCRSKLEMSVENYASRPLP